MVSSPSISKSMNLSTGSLTIREIILGVDTVDLSGCKVLYMMCWECLSKMKKICYFRKSTLDLRMTALDCNGVCFLYVL